MLCGLQRGPNGLACLAADKARSVIGPSVNVLPLLAAAPQASQKEGSESESGGRKGGLRNVQAQTGQWWPFNLARSSAESLIKPRAVKTEPTAKPVPETDTHSHSHLTVSFLFSIVPFQFWLEKLQEKTQHKGCTGTAGP